MLKRFARLRLLGLIAGLTLASACTAQPGAATAAAAAPPTYTEGTDYVTLPGPIQRYSSDGKVEVVEVFSYGCIHCSNFAPMAANLRKQLPAGAVFKLMPAPFSAEWLPYAQAYYAAKQLGVVDRTHLALFDAKFNQHYPLSSLDELADFYAREGVNRADFMRIANSPEVTAKMKSDLELIQHWQVDGTPSLIIDGKYKVTGAKSEQGLADIALWLAKRELGAK
jgi:thiol:disulfide interchange protein DsbA